MAQNPASVTAFCLPPVILLQFHSSLKVPSYKACGPF